jgi:hypothetical protein
MNRRDRIRRQWTHRRLGLGTAIPADAAMARTDALLTAVGGRSTSTGSIADTFESALLDFVCDLDLAAGIADLETRPLPVAALRLSATPPRKRRFSWQVLIPAMGGGLAAVVATVALLIGGSSASRAPALSATAESKQLLSHADLLLAAAQHATDTERTQLVAEAKADLTHVARLLPLAPPPERPAIRSQLNVLNQRARPLARPPADSGQRGANRRSGGGAVATHQPTAPAQETPQRSAATAPTYPPPQSRPAAGTDARRQPPPSGADGSQQSGTRPPPPSGTTTQGGQPPSGQTQSQPVYGGGNQPPPGGQGR